MSDALLPFVLPVFLISRWSIRLAKARNNMWFGIVLFAISAIMLAMIYFSGYAELRELIAEKMSTAASAVLMAMFLKSTPVMLFCWIAHWLLWPKDDTGTAAR